MKWIIFLIVTLFLIINVNADYLSDLNDLVINKNGYDLIEKVQISINKTEYRYELPKYITEKGNSIINYFPILIEYDGNNYFDIKMYNGTHIKLVNVTTTEKDLVVKEKYKINDSLKSTNTLSSLTKELMLNTNSDYRIGKDSTSIHTGVVFVSMNGCVMNGSLFVIAYSELTNDNIEFKVFQTNGTVVSNATVSLGSDDYSHTFVRRINSTSFLISYKDSADYASWQVYNIHGKQEVFGTAPDTGLGNIGDVVGCPLSDKKAIIAYADDDETEISVALVNLSTGAIITAETEVDADSDLVELNRRYVYCSTLNETTMNLMYIEGDMTDANNVLITVDSTNVISVGTHREMDSSVGNGPQIATNYLFDENLVNVLYDDAQTQIAYIIRNTTEYLRKSYTIIDGTTTGANVDVAPINDSRGLFAIFYTDDTDNKANLGIYNSTGAVNLPLFEVDSNIGIFASRWKAASVISYQKFNELSLCKSNDTYTMVAMWMGTDNYGLYQQYHTDGNVWNGSCQGASVPPVSTCTYTSGDWDVTCSDNCDITTDVIMNANTLFLEGTGTFYVNANISVEMLVKDVDCIIVNEVGDNNKLSVKLD